MNKIALILLSLLLASSAWGHSGEHPTEMVAYAWHVVTHVDHWLWPLCAALAALCYQQRRRALAAMAAATAALLAVIALVA